MKILVTNDINEWLDTINSKHSLPLNISSINKDNFFSTVDILTSLPVSDVKFIETHTSPYTANYIPQSKTSNKDHLLLTHSFGHFIGHQNNYSYNHSGLTFSLDLSQSFEGNYPQDGHTKSLVLPFDRLPLSSIDFFKKNKIEHHPFYVTINSLLKSITTDESEESNCHKIQAIVNLLSIVRIEEKKDIMTDITGFIDKCIINKTPLDLDALASAFFMSRRKMQYLLSEHGWTYRKLVASAVRRYKDR